MRAELVSGNSKVSTGAAGETQLAISGVSKHFGGVRAVEERVALRPARRSSSRSSARTAPARPRSST